MLRIPIAAPSDSQQQLCISLLDDRHHVLACWQDCAVGARLWGQAAAHEASSSTAASQVTCQGCNSHRCSTHVLVSRPVAAPAQGCCLVYQQAVLGAAGQLQVQVGPDAVQLAVQELWVAFPGPGEYVVKVRQLQQRKKLYSVCLEMSMQNLFGPSHMGIAPIGSSLHCIAQSCNLHKHVVCSGMQCCAALLGLPKSCQEPDCTVFVGCYAAPCCAPG